MKLLCTLLYFSIAVATINARHRKEWKRVDPRKSTRELLLPFYHSLSPACNHGAGFFRDPSDCHQYIRCVDDFGNGRRFSVFVGRCEPGLVFDENISACNWPELAAPCSDAPEKIRETFSKFKPKEDEVQLILEDNVISEQSDEQNIPYPVQEQLAEEHQDFSNQFVQEPQFFDVTFFQDQRNHQDSQILSNIREPGTEGSFHETSASKESPMKPQQEIVHDTSVQEDALEMSEHQNFQEPIVQQQQQLTHEQSVFQEPTIQQKEQSAHNQAVFQKPLIQQQEQLPEEQPIFQNPAAEEQELVAQEMPVFTEIAFQDKETDLGFESFQKPAGVQEQTKNQNEGQVPHQQPASEAEINQIGHQEKQETVGAFQEIVDDETHQIEIQSNEGYKSQQEQSQWWIPDENTSQHSAPEIQTDDNKGKPISESVTEKPILCLSEGFFSHPENCSRFIRCVRIDQSVFAIHFFECPHQLVFSEKDSSCIVSDAQNCRKNNRSKRQVKNAPLECKAEGFFRHPADCRSFYRCVKQPTGIYETHSFSCPDTLVFDEEYATCNWPEKAPPCEEIGQSYKTTGRPSYQPPTTVTRPSYRPPATATRPSYQPPERNTRPSYQPPERSTRPSYQPPERSTRPSYQPPERSTRPSYQTPTPTARSSYQPPQKSTSKIYRSTSKPRNDFNDNLNPLIPVREYTTQRTTLKTKYATQRTTQKPKYTEKPVTDNYGDQKCKDPGFYPHEKDCNKFYKCIKKGDYFVRYELSCPPNFAYDETTSRCVAQRYVSSCSRRRTPYPPKQDDEEISTTESSTPDNTNQIDSDVSCTEEGYFRHPDDCNRFYRCVDYNGDGQEFVRYDFKCPEGLVFDETNSVCNWPDESAPCDGKVEKDDDKDSSSEGKESGVSSTTEKSTTVKATAATTESSTQEPSTTSSSSITPEDSSTGGVTTEDSGYGGSESKDSTKKPGENEKSGTCTQEGFFRNPEDCNKFYRCVDFNGDGQEFVRYDFSCPEGLVFDEANSVCNWPDESAPCDGTSGNKSGGGGQDQGQSSTSQSTSQEDRESTPKDESTTSTSTSTIQSGGDQGESSTSRSTSQQDRDSTPKDESTTSTSSSTTRSSEDDSITSSAAVESTTGKTTSASSSTQSRDESSSSDESSNKGECTEAGFFRNPEDCSKFYRCVDYNGDGQEFVRYDFSCPEGLVFDEVNSVCNWPDESAPCDGTSGDKSGGSGDDQGESSTSRSTSQQGRESTPKDESTTSTSTSTIQSGGDQGESSTSRSTSQQDRDSTPKDESTTSTYSSTTRSSEDDSTTSSPSKGVESTTGKTTSASSSTQSRDKSSTSDEGASDGECTEAGFFRNPEDCNKFYRCVDYNGDGQEFVRYDFACPEGLVFDEVNSVCNWPEQSAPCDTREGNGSTKAEKTTTDSYQTTKSTTEYPSEDRSTEYPSEDRSTEYPSEDRSTESTSFTTDSSTSRTQTTSRSTQPPSTTESTYTTQSSPSTSRSTRKPTQAPPSTTESTYTTESSSSDNSATGTSTEASESTSRGVSESGGDVECTEEGFFRNPEDCNKFYRCVDFNGDGQQYVRYDFECPEGLYFDEVNSVCNWPEQSPKCEINAGRESTSDSGTSTSQKEDSSSVGTQSTTQQTSAASSEVSTTDSYTTSQSSSTYSTTTQSSSTYSTTTQNSECEKPGFYRYPDDCTKFYRCVDETGDGKGLVRYDFKCPDGLIFDDKNKKCDWPHSDTSCEVDSSTSSEKTTQPTKDYTSSTASTTRSSTTAGTTSGTTSSTSSSYEECTEEGFFRNPDDCSKYYRCIDEGDGTFTREDYACAEDEIFDEEMRYCNRKDLAPPCDGSTTEQASSSQSQGTTGGTTAVYPTESSTKGEKSECSKPGFFRCPEDCNKFYRCVDEEGDGQNLVRYDFKCPDGLIFDEKNKKCDWPSSELTCDTDSTTTYSTQTTRTSTSQSSKPQTTKDYTTSTRPSTSGTSGTTSDVTSASGECTEEGFFRNPDDCSKYYRCIDTGYGTYTREDYACEEDEVFDEEMRYCNRKDLAPPCDGSTTGQTSSQTRTTTDKTTSVYTTEKQTSTSTTQKATTAYPTESSTGGSKSDCEEEGFFRCPEDCNKFYRCVKDGEYLVRYDFKCPEGLIFDEKNKKCDWPSSELTCDDNSSATSSSSYPSTTKTTASSGSTSSSGECIEEGFFRNPDDCSKYYRCIDEGDGTLTREDFACEEDEVFDEEMRYCNKKDLAPPCEDSQSSTTRSSSTSTSKSATTRPSTSSTSESSTSRSSDSTTKESSTTEGYESTSGTSKKDSESGDCEEEGFHRHPDDCSKFYRCVDFKGDGQSFTRYDFDCPDGLVFDEDNDVCNWPSAVPSCESSTSNDRSTSGSPDSGVSGTSSNPQESSQTTSSGASTTVQEGSETSSTTGDVSQDSSSTTVTDRRSTTPRDEDFSSTTTKDRQSTTSEDANRSSTGTSTRGTSDGGSSENIECTEEGFFRHPEDCSKFYRCVDFAGTGESFVRYDFDCPEGLVFDEVNSVCNWPNQSPGCESGSTRRGSDESSGATPSNEKVSKTTTEGIDTTRDGTSTSESSFSSSGTDSSRDGTSTSEGSISSSETDKTTESATSGTSSGTTSAGDFHCEEEGFFKNPNDCKKYYECKRDDETGELIKIDCECPEGHVFDSEGWYCNAEELSPPCDEGSFRCTEEGFFRDPEDCTKYYQCNKTGPGNDDFTSKKFQCPDGYVFDENGRYCNAPELSEPCDETSGSTRITKSDESVSSTTSATTSSSASSTSSSVSKGDCTEEGFFRNPEDCSKYYQCSRNEDTGEIERTDFACPDGRIFDEGPSYCNDPQLSEEPCESGSTSTTRKQTNAGNADSSTSTAEQTPGSTSSSEGSQADSRKSGGGPQCSQEGFFRHPDDCNKFYRCVDFSGSGESFVRYDFDCPEGLHFDEVNSVCNWPTMTPACKSESSSFL